ncbi:MAG: DUF4230 domain-containing protein [Spirochaetes bacterium]|nr:DUF4230 domain-containing protein [Spirochaetota bacterium]
MVLGSRVLIKVLLRILLPAALVVAVLIALVRFEILDAPLRRLAEDLGLMSRETRSTSQIILEELREVYALETVEYIYRTVFPFDYMPETTDLTDILNTLRYNSGPIDEVLTDDQQLYFDAFNLADEVGLAEEEFIVLTVRVYAGFDLAGTPLAAGGGAPAPEPDVVTVDTDEESGRRQARIGMPPAEVTDILIEDVDPSTYHYPDVGLDAEGWRKVAAFVSEHVEARTIEEGILEDARRNARDLVRSLLLSAGIDQISFENEPKSSANSEERR